MTISSTNQSQQTHVDGSRVDEVIIVSSPKAGSGAGRDQLPKLIDRLKAANITTTATTSIDTMQGRLQQCHDDNKAAVIVAAGGDGTLSLVADLVENDVALVPMPLGTENLLARYYGHTHDAEHVFQTITSGQRKFVDAGRANGKLFLVMATCGFDAEVVRAVHLRRKGHINRFSYAMPILRAMKRYAFPAIDVTMDSAEHGQHECRWAMAFNLPRYGGGLSIEPDAVGDDQKLDVITFKNGGIFSGLCYFARVLTRRHRRAGGVVRQTAQTITFTSKSRVPYQLDGDYAGQLPLSIETLPGRVQLLVPADT